jgi:lyso-ornithine lipid O-acyltransferase
MIFLRLYTRQLGAGCVVGRPLRAPTVLVANHLSYVDMLILALQMRAVFVAKTEVASWPVIGALCRATQTIFLNR